MAIVVHTVNLQVAKTTTELFMVNQNESRSQAFAITVYDANYQPIDLSGAANVTLHIQKPDGTLAQVPAESVNFKTAVFIPNVQAFTASGDCTCFLQAVGPTTNQYDFTACPFTIRVHQTRFNQITSENDFAQIALFVATAQGAESWAQGGTGTRPGEDTNNAKYWAQLAQAAVGTSGTWTPKITNGRTGATITHVSDGCTYYRIGKILVCSYDVYIDNIPSGATDLMYVSGLPGTPVVGHAAAGLYWYRLNISIVSLNVTVEPAGFFFWRTTAAADTNGNPLTSNNLKPGGTAAGTRLRGTLFMVVS